MTTDRLTQTIVDTDVRLSREHESATERLAQWRWHWTLDESNPDRVSLAEYARLVGRNRGVISEYARGWAVKWAAIKAGETMTITEAIDRAALSPERFEAARAVAAARGVTTKTARAHYSRDVREVRHRADARGTSLAHEAREVARLAAQPVKTEEDEATSYLNGAARELAHALASRERAGVSDDTAERDAFARVERYLAAYRQAIEGVPFEDTVQEADRRWLEEMGVSL